jgi:hypothetical protein
MVSHTIAILQTHYDDPLFHSVIREALDFISSSTMEEEHGPTGKGQTTKSIAKLQAFRKRAGYYKLSRISGLDETIKSLENHDATVWARVLETDRGYITVWSNDDDVPLGVMIFKRDGA